MGRSISVITAPRHGFMTALSRRSFLLLTMFAYGIWALACAIHAQPPPPSMTVQNLDVRTTVSGLNQPTSMAFIGPNDFFVLEKATGNVKRVTNGVVQGTVLDLAVNNASERGLLGIVLHPGFPTNPSVYLYWTCLSTAPLDDDPFQPEEQVC